MLSESESAPTRAFISNVPLKATAKEVGDLFEKFGAIKEVK
jgi:RNA recognition motif-containing protein